jgi:hypothetical protein
VYRCFGPCLGETASALGDDLLHEAGEVAAVEHDGLAQFAPQRMARQDAEITADVGEDGADRAAAHHRVKPGGKPCRDLLRCWQAGERRITRLAALDGGLRHTRLVCGWRGLWPARGVEAGGVADEAFFQDLRALQALGDAGEDQRNVGGVEVAGVGSGIAKLDLGGEVAAVVDELADQGEQAADAAWWGLWAGGGRRIGHEQNRNTDRRPRQGIIVSGSVSAPTTSFDSSPSFDRAGQSSQSGHKAAVSSPALAQFT